MSVGAFNLTRNPFWWAKNPSMEPQPPQPQPPQQQPQHLRMGHMGPQPQPTVVMLFVQDNKCRKPVRVVGYLDFIVAIIGFVIWAGGSTRMLGGIQHLESLNIPVSDLLYFSLVWSFFLFFCNFVEIGMSFLLIRATSGLWPTAKILKYVYIWFGFNIFLMTLTVIGGAVGAPVPSARNNNYLQANIFFTVGNLVLVVPRIIFYCIVFQYVLELRDAERESTRSGRGAGGVQQVTTTTSAVNSATNNDA